MHANALLLAGLTVLTVGLAVRLGGDRATGGAVLVVGAAVLIASRIIPRRPPR